MARFHSVETQDSHVCQLLAYLVALFSSAVTEPIVMENSQNKIVKFVRMCWRYDITTSAGRRVQSLKIIGVALVAIFGLLFFVVEDVYDANKQIQQANALGENVQSSLEVASLIHRLQIERGLTVLCMGSTTKKDREEAFDRMNGAREQTDKILSDTSWPFDRTIGADFLQGVHNFRTYLNNNRYFFRSFEAS